MKKSLLWYLVLIQLTIIVIIGYKIYTKIQINSSTNISINPIKKDDIVLTPNDGLNYFFEPHASSTIVDKVEWLSFIPEHKINSDSLNEQHDYSILKPKKTVRIIID